MNGKEHTCVLASGVAPPTCEVCTEAMQLDYDSMNPERPVLGLSDRKEVSRLSEVVVIRNCEITHLKLDLEEARETLLDLVRWTRRCDCRDLCGGAFDRAKDVFVHADDCEVGAVFKRARVVLEKRRTAQAQAKGSKP